MAISDEGWQLSILSHVLVLHPERLSAAELRREMCVDERDFEQVDGYDRGVDDLVAAGLLRYDGDSIVPTRAAVYFESLHR